MRLHSLLPFLLEAIGNLARKRGTQRAVPASPISYLMCSLATTRAFETMLSKIVANSQSATPDCSDIRPALAGIPLWECEFPPIGPRPIALITSHPCVVLVCTVLFYFSPFAGIYRYRYPVNCSLFLSMYRDSPRVAPAFTNCPPASPQTRPVRPEPRHNSTATSGFVSASDLNSAPSLLPADQSKGASGGGASVGWGAWWVGWLVFGVIAGGIR